MITEAERLTETQTKLEQEMLDQGIAKFLKQVHDAADKGDATRLGGFRSVLKEMVDPLAARIEDTILNLRQGHAQAHRVRGILAMLEPRVTAYIAVKAIIDTVSYMKNKATLSMVVADIGRRLEFEARLRAFAKDKPAEFAWMTRDLAERQQTTQHREKVMIYVMNRHGITTSGWSDTDRHFVGARLLTWFAELSNLISIKLIFKGKKKRENIVRFSPEALEDIEEINRLLAFNHPHLLPCVIPPRDWTTPLDGGYHNAELRRRNPLVKTPQNRPRSMQRAYLEELRDNPAQLAPVYHAVNAMQRTPWQINSKLHDVMKAFWRNGVAIAGLVQLDPTPLPPKPADIDTNEEARKGWRRRAAAIHEKNANDKSKRVHVAQILESANAFREYERIYFPYALDFRGRAYALPFLNPQGPDWVRGLIHFADAKPITDGVRAGWLAIQGANLYGEADKQSLEDRIAWIESHEKEIKAAACDPFASKWWTEADSPWQFLAWCFDWTGFLTASKEGRIHTSRTVVSQDGTCSGLQHFSAILRDERGGASVNLTPSPAPRDIYAEVANVVHDMLVVDAKADDPELANMAAEWIDTKLVNRKLTKRPVMIVPYSGTIRACRRYVREYLNEVGNPFDNDWPYIRYISNLIWAAIQSVVVSARTAMKWLQSVAKLATKARVPITWTTPVGFPVVQYYPKLEPHRIHLKVGGSPIIKSETIRLTLLKTTGEIDPNEQRLGIAPNFIHSMDAAAMIAYLNYATENGITHFSMVHDSFGTHAHDAQMSSNALRRAFVDMYEGNDVLMQFKEDVAKALPPELAAKLPDPPPNGSLDLNGVMKSDYFFA